MGTPKPHKGGVNFLFVKLTTDDGTIGYGECPWIEHRAFSTQRLIEELSEGFIEGQSPFEIENLRKNLYRSNHSLHVPGPLQAQVIGAVEIACWDIIGKSVDEPIYNLLGGKINDEIRSYTYLHYKWSPPASPEEAAEAVAEYVEQGFTGIKLDPIPPYVGPREISLAELNYAEDVIKTIRQAVGEDCDIIVGTHGQLTTADACKFANRIEPYEPLWFEEPVPPERSDEMAKVAKRTTIPIAAGERITTIHQAAELLEKGAVDVFQPNLGVVGLLEAKKMAGMAEGHYTQIAPWQYCGPIAWAASLHLDACSPNLLIQEGIERWEGFHAEIVEKTPSWEDGYIHPPSGPGLGVVLDEDALSKYPPQ